MQYKGLNPVQVHINPSVVAKNLDDGKAILSMGFRVRVRAFQLPRSKHRSYGTWISLKMEGEIAVNFI
jgi:hypothetical protein